MENQKPNEGSESPLKKLGLFAIIVADLFGYTSAGVGLGWLAWQKAGLHWSFLLFGGITGMGLAFYKIYKIGRNL